MDLGRGGEYSFTVGKTREVSKTSRVSDATGGVSNAETLPSLRGGVLPTVVKGKVANPRFTLSFGPAKAHVRAMIYDILGRKLATVADQQMSAGYTTPSP